MTTQVQKRRGTTSEHSTFTGAEGEITVDTTKDTAVVHDGVSAGGKPLAREDLSNVSASTVATKLNGTALSGIDINSGAIDSTTIGATAPASGAFTSLSASGNIAVSGTVDGRDGAADGAKLDGIEAGADVTDTTNVTAAGALMDSELTDITAVKAINQGLATSDDVSFNTVNGRSIATDGTKLDGIEAGADVTDTANVTAAGALMDSELTDITAVKAINQGVATTDSPTFAGIDVTGTATMDGLTVDGNVDASYTGDDTTVLRLNHDGTTGLIQSANIGTGYTDLDIEGKDVFIKRGIYGSLDAIKVEGATGDISFYEDTGTTAKFFWDASAESLGIGTSSPDASLHLYTLGDDLTAYNGSATDGQLSGGVSLHLENDANNNTTYTQIVMTPRTAYGHNRIVSSGGSAPYMAFATNNAEAMRIDSSGNVGIGTSSPTATLSIEDNSYIAIDASDATYPYIGSVGSSTDTCVFGSWGDVIINADFNNSSANNIIFKDGTIERMRIDSSGNLLVGTTSTAAANPDGGMQIYNSSGQGVIKFFTNDDAQAYRARFYNAAGGSIGYISTTASATTYATSSDYRLKEDVQPMIGSIDRLKQLKPVNFAWIATGERTDGFIAHEAAEVVPEAVTGDKDAMEIEEYEVSPAVLDDEGNVVTEAVMGEREVPDYQGIDQSKLVPLLTAALQEALTRIETLEAKVAVLENN